MQELSERPDPAAGDPPDRHDDVARGPLSRSLPRMPAMAEPGGSDPRTLRRFHLTGEGLTGARTPDTPLLPAALVPLLEANPEWKLFPLVVSVPANGDDRFESISLHDLLKRELEQLAEGGTSESVLAVRLQELVRVVDRRLVDGGGTAPLRPTLRDACTTLALALGPEQTSALEREAGLLEARLPGSATLFAAAAGTLSALYIQAVERRRRRGDEFRRRVDELRSRLVELLRVDAEHDPGALAAGTLAETLGQAAAEFVSAELLSTNVPRSRGPQRLAPSRRARIERAVEELSAYLHGDLTEPDLLLVEGEPGTGSRPPWVRSIRDDRPLAAAAALFDEVAERLVATLRACHVARLEAEGRYEPELHDALLAPLHWRDLPDEELLLMPVVAVVETAERVRRDAVAEFSALMQSRRPVQLLIEEPCRAEDDAANAGEPVALGYLAVAHREVFVLQSTLARPVHLFTGLLRMAASPRPATAIVAVAPRRSPWGPLPELDSALAGRATPCYCYDASAGTSWADRFDTEGNPEPGRPWPHVQLRFLDPSDAEREQEEAYTFAHAAALDPAFRDGFRIISTEEWDEDQLEMGRYLELPVDRLSAKLPFVWVQDGEGNLARAVATRRIVLACRERLRAWRVYQELAGTDNVYVERAASEARRQALEEAALERDGLARAQAEELERTRVRATDLAVERLVAALIEGKLPLAEAEAASLALPAVDPAPASTEEVAPPSEAEPAEPEPEPDSDEGFTFEEPFIDSAMCTTCNDCTKINPRMFKYNADQQAYIADATAGTFEQLVRAAEKCPARCIHPGRPRPEDKSATPAMIARAAPFNE